MQNWYARFTEIHHKNNWNIMNIRLFGSYPYSKILRKLKRAGNIKKKKEQVPPPPPPNPWYTCTRWVPIFCVENYSTLFITRKHENMRTLKFLNQIKRLLIFRI